MAHCVHVSIAGFCSRAAGSAPRRQGPLVETDREPGLRNVQSRQEGLRAKAPGLLLLHWQRRLPGRVLLVVHWQRWLCQVLLLMAVVLLLPDLVQLWSGRLKQPATTRIVIKAD